MKNKNTRHMQNIGLDLKRNKRGVESEGTRFNTDQAAIIIIFLILLAILIILIIPRVGSGNVNGTVFNFGKTIYDVLSGKGAE